MALVAREILETSLYVNDLAAARDFYLSLLGLTVVDEQPGRHLFLRCGNRMLLLFRADATSDPDGTLPPHGATGPGHVAFATSQAEYDAWRTRLQEQQVPIEKEIAWPNGGQSLYFRDPAGNSLEIATPKLWELDERKTLGV